MHQENKGTISNFQFLLVSGTTMILWSGGASSEHKAQTRPFRWGRKIRAKWRQDAGAGGGAGCIRTSFPTQCWRDKWQAPHFGKKSHFFPKQLQATSKEASTHVRSHAWYSTSVTRHTAGTFKHLIFLNVWSFTAGYKFIIATCLHHWGDAMPCWNSTGQHGLPVLQN